MGLLTLSLLVQLTSASEAWGTTWQDGVGTTPSPSSDSVARLVDGVDALRRMEESGQSTSVYAYDTSHRLGSVTRGTDVVDYGYVSNSQRVQTLTKGSASVTYGYDSLARLNNLSGNWGSTTVSWEPGGQRLTSLNDSLVSETFCFDGPGRIARIEYSGSSCTGASSTARIYTHDRRGNPLSETFGGVTRTFTTDSADRLQAFTDWSGVTTSYVLNADGTRQSETVGGATRTYGYDSATGALTSVTDSNNNVVASWSYLNDGRVSSRTLGSVTSNYSWNAFGRLVAATTAAGNSTFEYDGQGLRRASTLGGVQIESFTWVGERQVAEGSELLASVGPFLAAQGNTRFGHDALGSIVTQARPTGSPSAAQYSVWGAQSGGSQLTSNAYTSHRRDATLGLTQAQQRWLDNDFGVFLSRDPVGAASRLVSPNGLGPWSYAALNPLRYTDPDGRWELDPGYSGQPASPAVQAEGYAFAYRAYRHGIQTAGEGVHWAAWQWTEAAEGILSIPTSTPGVYISTPESRVAASGLGAGVEFTASLPVAIAGIGLMPEMLWNSGDEYSKAEDEIRQGWVYGNQEQFLTGVGRMSGTIGLWAGAAGMGMGMSRSRIFNRAPVSELARPSNWHWETDPQVVYSGVPPPKYVGPLVPLARRIGIRGIQKDDAWGRYQIAKGRFPYEEGWQLSSGEPVWLDTPIGPEGIIEAKFTGGAWEESLYNLTELAETNPATAAKVRAKLVDQARRLIQLRAELDLPAVEYRTVSPELTTEFTKLLTEEFPAEIKAGTLRVKHAPWRQE